jgi:hypothetical protein
MFANDVLKGKSIPVTGGGTGLGHARIVKPTTTPQRMKQNLNSKIGILKSIGESWSVVDVGSGRRVATAKEVRNVGTLGWKARGRY